MSKFVNYNSAECQILKQAFEKMPMMDTYVANIVEEYIYATVKETDEEGNIIEYRTKYGEKDGEYKMWFPNGELSMETTYVDGKMQGVCNEFFDDGRFAIQSYYKDDKLHGEFKEWLIVIDTDKHYLSKQTTYIDGKLHGEYKFWGCDGLLSKHSFYKNGRIIKQMKMVNYNK